MTTDPLATLHARLRELQHLNQAMALLGWDHEVTMPPRGATGRAAQRATLAGVIHEKMVDAELGVLLEDLGNDPALTADDRANVREARRLRDRAVRLPRQLVHDLAETVGLAHAEWVAAREHDDWSRFAPHLARIVDLKRQEARALDIGDEPYDALLDEFEPGARTAALLPVFADLEAALRDLLAGLDTATPPPILPPGPYPRARQAALGREVLVAMGYDLAAGRLDVSAHPFSESMGPGDVRVTTRYDEDDLLSGLTATMHEGGHALYEQGLPEELRDLPAGQAVSLGIHESQSLLWENHVGRGRPFGTWLTGRLREHFPDRLAGLDPDHLVRVMNVVRPGLIRIEADEVTYNLHVILRLRIERALLNDELDVADIPHTWRELSRDLLGVEVPDDRRGALQDIHWCMGAIGYFPTYTLGKLYAAMFWNAARRDLPDLDTHLAAGDCQPLREWLGEHIHRQAARQPAADLCREVCGHHLRADDFVAHLRGKYAAPADPDTDPRE
ncbi:carboxypeptidase M32 [bacterium]|nr:carboxypeptidase M32 [bacterium]